MSSHYTKTYALSISLAINERQHIIIRPSHVCTGHWECISQRELKLYVSWKSLACIMGYCRWWNELWLYIGEIHILHQGSISSRKPLWAAQFFFFHVLHTAYIFSTKKTSSIQYGVSDTALVCKVQKSLSFTGRIKIDITITSIALALTHRIIGMKSCLTVDSGYRLSFCRRSSGDEDEDGGIFFAVLLFPPHRKADRRHDK